MNSENKRLPGAATATSSDWYSPEIQEGRAELLLSDLPNPAEIINSLAKKASLRPCKLKDDFVTTKAVELFSLLDRANKAPKWLAKTDELGLTAVEEAMADVILALLQKAVSMGINIGGAIIHKHGYNQRH